MTKKSPAVAALMAGVQFRAVEDSLADFSEVELATSFRVDRILRREKRGLPLVAAVVSSLENASPEAILILSRAELPEIQVGNELYLSVFTCGACKIYRETLPR